MEEKLAEQKEQQEEDIITIDDYAKIMYQQEKEALVQLKKDESTVCSYSKGQINQTIFGCKTCGINRAGFCLACYLNCHWDHELFEIGLKRNFQCECGVSKCFNDPCSLLPNKEFNQTNESQKDHNFDDKFCICNQKYSDKEFMINCISCLDYFHLDHIGLNENESQIVQENENLTEMICPECLKNRFSFLLKYEDNKLVVFSLTAENQENNNQEEEVKKSKEKFNDQGKRLHQEEDCFVKNYNKEIQIQKIKKPLFLVRNWSDYICYCETCQQLYKTANITQIEDIIDQNANWFNEDFEELTAPVQVTTQEIEEIEGNYEKLFKELIQKDFIASSNVAHALNNMTKELNEFLKPFSSSNEIVTPDHVKAFFKQFNTKNKLKSKNDN